MRSKLLEKKGEKTYASAKSSNRNPNSSSTSEQQKYYRKFDYNIAKSLRLQGVKEDLSKSKGENLVHKANEVIVIMNKIGVNATVKELKRLGKFKSYRACSRKLLLNLQSEQEVRLVLVRATERTEILSQRSVFLLPATKDSALIKQFVFGKRKHLLDEGTLRKKSKTEVWNCLVMTSRCPLTCQWKSLA